MSDSVVDKRYELIDGLSQEGYKPKCEWCHEKLPGGRYHLRICPKCRKATIDAFLKGEL